jgi:hypothetical protein
MIIKLHYEIVRYLAHIIDVIKGKITVNTDIIWVKWSLI